MDTYGSVCIEPRFLDFGTSWRRVLSFTPRLLAPGEGAPHNVENRKLLTLPGLETRLLCRPARSKSPYRPSSPGSWICKTGCNYERVCKEWQSEKILTAFVQDLGRWKNNGCWSSLFGRGPKEEDGTHRTRYWMTEVQRATWHISHCSWSGVISILYGSHWWTLCSATVPPTLLLEMSHFPTDPVYARVRYSFEWQDIRMNWKGFGRR
jgi:hypothetical protein